METQQRVPLWYEYFCKQVIELREHKTREEIFYDHYRLGGYISGLHMSDVISTSEALVFENIKSNAFTFAFDDLLKKEISNAPF